MKRWRVGASTQPLPAAVVADVMAGIGTPDLAAGCLRAMQRVLPVTFCTVFVVDASGRLETVSAASSYGRTAEQTAARYIAARFDRRDPHMTWLAARALPASPQRWIGHHRGDELADAAYRTACYDDVGIRERASVLSLLPTGERAAVGFYRSLAQPVFDAADFACIGAHAALLADAVAAHGRGAVRARAAVAPGAALPLSALSRREREVVAHLLAGRTAREAAQALGVALTTVRTHQYRAFRRLGVANLKALLRHRGTVETGR
ncbi:MAG: LuxR family transcriptional regulator [Variovorax sp.]|nr:MAG: LuxR family transcriptional regulator [Variovorax sp.]